MKTPIDGPVTSREMKVRRAYVYANTEVVKAEEVLAYKCYMMKQMVEHLYTVHKFSQAKIGNLLGLSSPEFTLEEIGSDPVDESRKKSKPLTKNQ